MALNSSDKEKFFAKLIPISVKDIYTNQTRTRHLFLTMEWQDSSPTLYSKKVLVLSLTDEEDPFFLYNLHLSEEDFQMLKASQNILIDFASFSQHIIDYIEKCVLEEKNPQPKYSLVLTLNGTSPSQLDIVENLPFKALTHLSLQFMAATETALRLYLTSAFRNLKEERRRLTSQLSSLERDSSEKLSSLESRLRGTEQELQLLRKEAGVQLSERDVRHSLQLQEERDRLLNRHKEEESRLEEEMKMKEQSLRKQIQQLESRVTCLDALNKELEERNTKQESSIHEHLSRILHLEKEAKKQRESILGLERTRDRLKAQLREKESALRTLEGELQDCRQEMRAQVQVQASLRDQVDLSDRQVRNLKAEMEKLTLQLEMHEKHEKVHEEEKGSLEQIIVKLQGKVEEAKAKCERSARYKTIAEEKEKLLADMKREAAEWMRNLETKNAEVQTLNNRIDFFHQKIESLEKDLVTKQNVIKFLNSELTKNCIIPQFGGPELSPSSVAQKELAKIGAPRKSIGSGNSPSSLTNNTRTTPSTVRPSSSTPNRFHASDSAYCTPTSDSIHHQSTPSENGHTIDPDALSGAFGDGNRVPKHSTAKKQRPKR